LEIFVDESFKKAYVMGAIVGQRHDIEDAIKLTRSYIKRHNKAGGKKINLPEIKDSVIHRGFPKIKEVVLDNLAKIKIGKQYKPRDIKIFSVYMIEEDVAGLKQTEIYLILAIELLKVIIYSTGANAIDICYDVFFDQYGEKVFKDHLYKNIIETFPDIKINLTHVSSEQDKALQAADVITGSIRRYIIREDTESLSAFTQKSKVNLRMIKQIKK